MSANSHDTAEEQEKQVDENNRGRNERSNDDNTEQHLLSNLPIFFSQAI